MLACSFLTDMTNEGGSRTVTKVDKFMLVQNTLYCTCTLLDTKPIIAYKATFQKTVSMIRYMSK